MRAPNCSRSIKTATDVLTADEYLPPLPPDAPEDAPRPPLPLIIKALDANGDGVIDAAEIANAPAALKSLDKNGDGQLTRDEYHRPRRPGPPPEEGMGGNDAGGPPPDGGDGSVRLRAHRPELTKASVRVNGKAAGW